MPSVRLAVEKEITEIGKEEALRAFSMADDSKKIVIESRSKVIIICALSREQADKIGSIYGN